MAKGLVQMYAGFSKQQIISSHMNSVIPYSKTTLSVTFECTLLCGNQYSHNKETLPSLTSFLLFALCFVINLNCNVFQV